MIGYVAASHQYQLTPDPVLSIMGLVIFGVWIVTLFNAFFTASDVWSAAYQRKWVVACATIFAGPILGSLIYWFGFRRSLKRRAHSGGRNDGLSAGRQTPGDIA